MEIDNISLKPLNKNNLGQIVEWLNNSKINEYLYSKKYIPYSLLKEIQWFNKVKEDSTKKIFSIYYNTIFIGVCGLSNINLVNKNAIISLFIGKHELWGKGIGGQVINLLLEYAFTSLQLELIYTCIHIENSRSIELFKKKGFKKSKKNLFTCPENMKFFMRKNKVNKK